MDAMHIQPSADSPILAFGTTSTPRSRWFWIWTLIVLAIVCGLLGVLWGLLDRPLDIPARTALLVSISPHASKSVSQEWTSQFPQPWKDALAGDSRWPVLLGAQRTPTGWQTFAIVATWYGSRRLITDHAFSNDTRPLKFTDAWRWTVWMDPRLVFLDDAPTDLRLEPFTAKWKNGALITTLAFRETATGGSLHASDISLRLSSAFPSDLVTLLPGRAGLARALAVSGAEPSELNFTFDNYLFNGVPGSLQLAFDKPLTETQAATILGGLGQHASRSKTLEDGVVITENVRLTSASGTLFGDYAGHEGPDVTLTPTVLFVGPSSTLSEIQTSCPGTPVIRVSGLTLFNLFNSVSVQTNGNVLPGLLVTEQGKHINLCLN